MRLREDFVFFFFGMESWINLKIKERGRWAKFDIEGM